MGAPVISCATRLYLLFLWLRFTLPHGGSCLPSLVHRGLCRRREKEIHSDPPWLEPWALRGKRTVRNAMSGLIPGMEDGSLASQGSTFCHSSFPVFCPRPHGATAWQAFCSTWATKTSQALAPPSPAGRRDRQRLASEGL